MSEWPLFVGRFHPLLVHLPIGFLILAALLEAIASWRRRSAPTAADSASSGAAWRDASGAALLAGAGSAAVAVATGYLLGHAGGYGGTTLIATSCSASSRQSRRWPHAGLGNREAPGA